MRARRSNRQVLLTTVEAAEALGMKRSTLDTWRVRGGGPVFIRVSQRCIRYRQADLDAWAEARVRRSTSDPGRLGRDRERG